MPGAAFTLVDLVDPAKYITFSLIGIPAFTSSTATFDVVKYQSGTPFTNGQAVGLIVQTNPYMQIAAAFISATPPSAANGWAIIDGTFWWNSADGRLYLNYNDGTSSQWVPAHDGAGPQGLQGIQGPQGLQGIQGATGNTGAPGQWTQVTQAQYNALAPPNPTMLYVIIG